MKRRNGLISAGAAAFLVSFVAGTPASAVVGWIGPDDARLSGVTGTLWRGSALAAKVGRVRLGPTRWSLSPLRLLLGQISAEVESRIGGGDASGSLAVGLSGELSCTACKYDGPAASLRPIFPALKALDGSLQLELANLELRDNWPVRAVGTAKLSKVALALAGAQADSVAPTADFEATLSADPVPDDGVIEVAIRDAGGPLQLNARLTVTPPGSYEFSGRLKARANAPPELASALTMLGPKTGDGGTELTVSGTF